MLNEHYVGLGFIFAVDTTAMVCILIFYWRVLITLKLSVAQDNERSQNTSQTTNRKKVLQRAFGLISAAYFVFFLPVCLITALHTYFDRVLANTPLEPLGKYTKYYVRANVKVALLDGKWLH